MFQTDTQDVARRFVESILTQPPTQLALQNAKKFVAASSQDLRLETKMILNDWIELAKAQVDKTGGGRGTLLDDEILRMTFTLSQVNKAQICLTNGEWRQVMMFSPGQHRVFAMGTIKQSAFGKIKRGVLIQPDPANPGKFVVTATKVAIKLSKLELATQGRRTTGEHVFESAEKELALMGLLARFNHPYMLTLMGAGRDDTNLIMLAPLGRFSVWDRLQNFSVENLLEYIHRVRFQVASALNFLHSLGFAHRDVSLENILEMDDGSFRLIDFGLASSLTLADAETGAWMPIPLDQRDGRVFAVGKLRYLSPEFFRRGVDMRMILYDAPRADMFSLGVCIFVIAYRAFPHQQLYPESKVDPTVHQLIEFWNDYDFENKFEFDPKLDWVRVMLAKDPARRLSAKQCVDLIVHI